MSPAPFLSYSRQAVLPIKIGDFGEAQGLSAQFRDGGQICGICLKATPALHQWICLSSRVQLGIRNCQWHKFLALSVRSKMA